MTTQLIQDFLWYEFFSDPTQWWDSRRNPSTPHGSHIRLSSWRQQAWVDWRLTVCEAGLERPATFLSTPGDVAPDRRAAWDVGFVELGRHCEDGKVTEAVDALNLLVQKGCHLSNKFFYRILKSCVAHKDLVLGRRVHALAVKSGYDGNAFLATHLIGLYASHGRLEEAMRVFSKVSTPDAYNWSSIILAYARHGEPAQAIRLYRQMRESTIKPDDRIFVAVLKACASAGNLAAGKDVHAQILTSEGEPNMFVQTCLVDMYAKCSSLEDARRVFDGLFHKDVVVWTAMIAAYVQQGMGQEALSLYSSMQQEGMSPPDSFTFACLLQACAGLAALNQGKQLHAHIKERGLQHDVVVGTSLVNMYVKCGSIQDAQKVFDNLIQKNVVTWTAMIRGYAEQGMAREALHLYSSMQQKEGIIPPDSVTFVCLLQACARVGVAALEQGKQLHAQIEEQGLQADVVVSNSLVNMYAKCGSLEHAQIVFDSLFEKDVVSWTAMIAGCAQQGLAHDALRLYNNMQQEGITPANSVTFVCLLQACATAAALPLGRQLHAQIARQGLQNDVIVGSSLVNLYAKCGSMEDAQLVFDSLPAKDIQAWNALIAGYTCQGEIEIVSNLFHRMEQDGIKPDGITFLSVLTVCGHVGLVDKGRTYFDAMGTKYGISPTIEHYTCMTDLLGRAGLLDEALQLVKAMPFQPTGAVWHTLLSACQKWSNVDVGRQTYESAVELDENDGAAYVLMSNIYKGAQMWEEAKEIHQKRAGLSTFKQPGQSWWTDIGGFMHAFVVGDMRRLESGGILSTSVHS